MNSFFFRLLLFPAYLLAQLLLCRFFPESTDLFAAGCFIILIIAVERSVFKEDTALERPEFTSLFLGLAAGFSFCTSLLFLMEATGSESGILTSLESVSDLCLSENISLLWIITYFVILPAAEELVFRSGLQNAAEQRFSIPASLLVSVVSFCAYGWIRDGSAGLFFCFLCGIPCALFFVFFENAWVSVFVHIGCSISLAFLYLRYFLSPALLLIIAVISFLSSALLVWHAYASFREETADSDEEEKIEEETEN